jgi:isoaspartyl peptidase/L-asparaginase-like protein (Ntn-hydrolase superfamily)
MCSSLIEETTKMVAEFSVTHKSEVENVSQRMELAGMKKCLENLEKQVKVGVITIDKHAQVTAYLRQQNYDYHFDSWHRLRGFTKDLLAILKVDFEF